MTVYFDKYCKGGKPVERTIGKSFEYFEPLPNHSWIDYLKAPNPYAIVGWLMEWHEKVVVWGVPIPSGDVYIHGYDPFYSARYGPIHPAKPTAENPNPKIKHGWFLLEFTSPELHEHFEHLFEPCLVKDRAAESVGLKPAKFDQPDEPAPNGVKNMFVQFPTGEKPALCYRMEDSFWGGRSELMNAREMGFDIEPGKLRNLLSLGDGEIGLWYYLAILPKHLRTGPVADEWINFILGPLAAALKVAGFGFEKRDQILCVPGLLIMFEAMELDLIPPGKRRPLYEALFARFNTECYALVNNAEVSDRYVPGWEASPRLKKSPMPVMLYERETVFFPTLEEASRSTFYSILADVVESIFDEASGDELGSMVDKALADNPKQAEEAKTDPKVVGWLMGQIMRASPTKLDPNTVRAAITAKL